MVLPNSRSPRLLVPAGNPTAASRAMLRFSAALSTVTPSSGSGSRRSARPGPPPRSRTGSRSGACRLAAGATSATSSASRSTSASGSAPRAPTASRSSRSSTRAVAAWPSSRSASPPVSDRARAAPRPRPCSDWARLDLPARARGARACCTVGTWDGSCRGRDDGACTPRSCSVPAASSQLPLEEMARARRRLRARPPVRSPRRRCGTRCSPAQESLAPPTGRARGSATPWTQLADGAAEDRPLPVGAWHGDWTPWNMSRRRGRPPAVGLGAVRDRRPARSRPLPLRRQRRDAVATALDRGGRAAGPASCAGLDRRPGGQDHLVGGAVPGRHRLPLPGRRRARARRPDRGPQPGDARGPGPLARDCPRSARPWLSASPLRRLTRLRPRARAPRPGDVAAPRGSTLWGRLTARWRLQPAFIIVGAQRAGTTTLYRVLSEHPQVVRPDGVQGHRLLRPAATPAARGGTAATSRCAWRGASQARAGRGDLREQRLLPASTRSPRSGSRATCPASRSS